MFYPILRAYLVTGNEFIDLMISYYHWNMDFLLGICIVEDFVLMLVRIDVHSEKNRVRCVNLLK